MNEGHNIEDFDLKIEYIKNEKEELIDTANHPQEIVKIPCDKKVYKNLISSNGNYLRCFEDFKLASEKLAHRSQCSFLIVKEFFHSFIPFCILP